VLLILAHAALVLVAVIIVLGLLRGGFAAVESADSAERPVYFGARHGIIAA
jgi:hypothetical protein